MNWFAKLITQYPETYEQMPGYGRTDAFGRIGNTVARYDDPVPLVGNVSFPSVWSMKYRDLFHYNGNTNSVLMRNIGQAFGLGAVLIDPTENFSSTVNVPGLMDLEKLMYKIKVPEYTEIMSDAPLNKEKILEGCNVYLSYCYRCHDGNKRVGPSADNQSLISYKTFSIDFDGLKTDPNQAVLQAKPINGKALRNVLFDFTKEVRDDFKSKHRSLVDKSFKFDVNKFPGMDSLNTNGTLNAVKETYMIRGFEEFRDTYFGLVGHNGAYNSYMNLDSKKEADYFKNNYFTNHGDSTKYSKGLGAGYAARHLSGVWATPPYLHNGSIVSIMDLLTPPERRIKKFRTDSGKFDPSTLGFQVEMGEDELKYFCDKSPEKCFRATNSHAENFYKSVSYVKKNNLNTFPTYKDINRGNFEGSGDSNSGHYFKVANSFTNSWDGLQGEENLGMKTALIEFLKVLRPEPEYAWAGSEKYYKIESNSDGQAVCKSIK